MLVLRDLGDSLNTKYEKDAQACKYEIRRSKYETNSKSENANDKNTEFRHFIFCYVVFCSIAPNIFISSLDSCTSLDLSDSNSCVSSKSRRLSQ